MLIKRLLKKYKYPPDGMEDALETVMTQCELWTDNTDMDGKPSDREAAYEGAFSGFNSHLQKVAESTEPYGQKHPAK